MAIEKVNAPAFDDIVFEDRNKEYGAYRLRKRYNRTVLVAMLVGIIILSTAIITPYINAKAVGNRKAKAELQVEIKLENLEAPENVAPPPPPPPPPADVVQQQKYVPPVVVDSIKPEDNVQLMTADEAQVEIKNEEVVEIVSEVKEEVKEAEAEEVPFVVVEEMPMILNF
jgi:protein TonB